MLKSMFKSKKGATVIEYALIAALVGGAMAAGSAAEAGQGVKTTFCKTASYISGGDGSSCDGAQTPPPPPPPPPPKTPQQQCQEAGDLWDTDHNYCWGGSTGNPPWGFANPGQKDNGQHLFS